MNSLNQALETQ